MVRLRRLKPLSESFLESLGFTWHTGDDGGTYVADEAVEITSGEADAYYEAANTLYDMYIEAGEYVIKHNLFHEIGIPFNLVEAIKKSWESEAHWHVYGRFDFAGGVGGEPIKLLEFNADTPTLLYETAVIQWALLKANGLNEAHQFNDVYGAIRDNFRRLIVQEDDPESFADRYGGWRMLFSAVRGDDEEENTTRLLQRIADDAGFHTAFAYADEVAFGEEGIFYEDTRYEYWFKLIPWEMIALEEGELAALLTDILLNQRAIAINPPYTLMFQSKGMLKILWDLFKDHPLLLPSDFEPLSQKQVFKPFFGREGGGIAVLDAKGRKLFENRGDFADQRGIYQAYVPLPKDERGRFYQAGVFFAYEGCGLGFRRGGEIIDNSSVFVGHLVT